MFIYCYIFVFTIYVYGKTKVMYNTIVVSWMDPKLLIKMFTRSSTGIPKNKKQTHCVSQHINHIHQTRRTKGHSSNLHSTLSHGLLWVTLTIWFIPWNICFHFMHTTWKAWHYRKMLQLLNCYSYSQDYNVDFNDCQELSSCPDMKSSWLTIGSNNTESYSELLTLRPHQGPRLHRMPASREATEVLTLYNLLHYIRKGCQQ